MRKIGIICLIILNFISCKKDSIIPEDNSNNKAEIRLGDYDKMLVLNQDLEIEGGYNKEKSLDLDINNDSIGDFRISSVDWGSPGLGRHPTVAIRSLDSVNLICGKLLTDTTFYHYQIDTTYDNSSSVTTINYRTTYSCQRIQENDSIIEIVPDMFHINLYYRNESIAKSDTYEYLPDNYVLTENWSGFYDGPVPNESRTTYRYWINYHYYNCYAIPYNESIYIGLKIIETGREKLGWIKLSVFNDLKVYIFETALQK